MLSASTTCLSWHPYIYLCLLCHWAVILVLAVVHESVKEYWSHTWVVLQTNNLQTCRLNTQSQPLPRIWKSGKSRYVNTEHTDLTLALDMIAFSHILLFGKEDRSIFSSKLGSTVRELSQSEKAFDVALHDVTPLLLVSVKRYVIDPGERDRISLPYQKILRGCNSLARECLDEWPTRGEISGPMVL